MRIARRGNVPHEPAKPPSSDGPVEFVVRDHHHREVEVDAFDGAPSEVVSGFGLHLAAGFLDEVVGGGGVAGYVTVEPIADRIGRLGSLMVMFLGSFAVVQAVFLLIRTPYVLVVAVALVGYFTLGGFGWIHVYLAELFARVARGTALATVFSLGRLVGFVVSVFAGYEIATFGAVTSVVASFGALYAVGIFTALYLPDGMERPFAEQDSS